MHRPWLSQIGCIKPPSGAWNWAAWRIERVFSPTKTTLPKLARPGEPRNVGLVFLNRLFDLGNGGLGTVLSVPSLDPFFFFVSFPSFLLVCQFQFRILPSSFQSLPFLLSSFPFPFLFHFPYPAFLFPSLLTRLFPLRLPFLLLSLPLFLPSRSLPLTLPSFAFLFHSLWFLCFIFWCLPFTGCLPYPSHDVSCSFHSFPVLFAIPSFSFSGSLAVGLCIRLVFWNMECAVGVSCIGVRVGILLCAIPSVFLNVVVTF